MVDHPDLKKLVESLNRAIEQAEHKPEQWAETAQSMGGICCAGEPFQIGKPWAKEEPWAHFSYKRDSWLAVAAVNALPQLIALIAESEALKGPHDWLAEDLIKELVDNAQSFQDNSDHGESDPFAIVLLAAASRIRRQEVSIDRLKAEIAGLKTGYEAYEYVNAELKAEIEALRDDLEQKEYDANAWRNGEESVWIEVFNSDGDDPFISAISGQITVEQLALIQAEILEYRENYFEKGSGLYVFKCTHYQAHHDNVGMTEPAHWEADFESYSPFPWEEEGAALAQGEQS
ncbi:hypothetical protein [Pseudomonas sp. TWR3-1-1]|uniref:hypothetical protein n=1 Tax=Pseudomonas sp. TWR3-1-1 TaxID=2804633 RepID=UPI003CF8AF81